ncbi:serine hydrolase [Kurthia sibirica]|uniref:serine hydrolase n=1 Tax=Kurthia sibirica TaxID=202750 RepID=UPI001172C9A6|nr:serine hydrolase [Kurthia sibirica]GEK35013.1 hypothetical protein KSI01_25460 [Kurthia sibirica]
MKYIVSILVSLTLTCWFYDVEIVKAQSTISFQKDVENKLDPYLNKVGGSVSIDYINLKTHEQYAEKSNKPYLAASTIKLPLALYIMELADANRIDLQQELTYKADHYVGGSGIIQNQSIGSRFTISDLVEKAIKYSDNIAFAMLKERIGSQNFINYMQNLGATNSSPQAYSFTSSHDLAIYAEHVDNLSRSSDNGKRLKEFLEETIYNEALPNGVSDATVAHKVGMMPINLVSHDYGIINDQTPYVLAIMTYGFSYNESNKVIAKVSELIHTVHHAHNKESKKIILEKDAIFTAAFVISRPIYSKLLSFNKVEITTLVD